MSCLLHNGDLLSKPIRRISALGAIALAAVGLAACGGGVPNDAVVQVNGNPVTKSTFDHWLNIVASSSSANTGTKAVVPDPPSYSACIAHLRSTQPKPAKGATAPSETQLKAQCEQQYTSYKTSALNFLIQANWIIGQAEEMNISASTQEVEKAFNKLKKEQFPKPAEYEKFLKDTGFTTSDLLLRVKVQSVLSPKIEQKVTKEAKNVTKARAEKYYNEHKSLYGQPEHRIALVVLTKTEAQAKSAKSEIQSGKSFASVAKARSIDPVSKAKGGELEVAKTKPQVRGAFSAPEAETANERIFRGAVFASKMGVLRGPVKAPAGYYIFEAKKALTGTQEPFSKVESSIKQQLRLRTSAEGACRLRQGISQALDGEDRMPLGIHGRTLQGLQGTESEHADHHDGAGKSQFENLERHQEIAADPMP